MMKRMLSLITLPTTAERRKIGLVGSRAGANNAICTDPSQVDHTHYLRRTRAKRKNCRVAAAKAGGTHGKQPTLRLALHTNHNCSICFGRARICARFCSLVQLRFQQRETGSAGADSREKIAGLLRGRRKAWSRPSVFLSTSYIVHTPQQVD